MNDNTAFTIILASIIVSIFVSIAIMQYALYKEQENCKVNAIQKRYTIQEIKELCK